MTIHLQRLALMVALMLLPCVPAVLGAQSSRSSEVILARVDSAHLAGAFAVIKRHADPSKRDIVFVAPTASKQTMEAALSALRHIRFVKPVPARDVTITLGGTRSSAANSTAMSAIDSKRGERLRPAHASLDVGAAHGHTQTLPDAYLR